MNDNVTEEWLDSVGLKEKQKLTSNMSVKFWPYSAPDITSECDDSYYGWNDSFDLNNVKSREDILTLCKFLGITVDTTNAVD